MGKGNRRLMLRLPSDHWIWEIDDPAARNAKVREALDFYWKFGEILAEIKQALETLSFAIPPAGVRKDASSQHVNDRLMASLDNFLEFWKEGG